MVRSRDARWFTKGVLAVALVGLAACSEQPTGSQPDLSPTLSNSGRQYGGGRRLVTSGARYRDTSVKPATGRSGSAAITAQAVFSSASGLVELVVTPYRAADLALANPAPRGCLEKVQVKAFSDDGKLLWTRNFNNLNYATGRSFSTSFAGLLPGARLAVQANVKCIDNRRTDVVTATPTVIRRTDPSVVSVAVPQTAMRNLPFIVNGIVQERNGDLGATGRCYLLQNGTQVDSIASIWVDAGSSVDCQFLHTVGTPGTYTFTVRFARVVPADDDSGNNEASAQVEVTGSVPPPPPPPPDTGGGTGGDTIVTPPPPVVVPPQLGVVNAIVYDDTTYKTDVYSLTYTDANDPSRVIFSDRVESGEAGNEQYAYFNGQIYEAFAFPLSRVVVSQTTSGVPPAGAWFAYPFTYHSGTFLDVADQGSSTYGTACADLSPASGGTSLLICASSPTTEQVYGTTHVFYTRSAQAATYVNERYVEGLSAADSVTPVTCEPTAFDPEASCYYENTSSVTDRLVPYGSTFHFSLLLESAGRRFQANIAIPLSVAPINIDVPLTCTDPVTLSAYPTWLYVECDSYNERTVRKSGVIDALTTMTQAF